MPRPTPYVDPLRYPRQADTSARDRRAWYLLILTTFFPGAAQLVAGNRRLARVGLVLTGIVWGLVILALVLLVFNREALLGGLTRTWALAVLTVLLAVFAVVWVICFLDTMRLVRFVGLSPKVTRAVAAISVVVLVVAGGGMAWGTSVVNSQRGLISGIFAGGAAVDPVDGRYNILLLGGDAGKGRTGNRPDSLSLVSIDAKTGTPVIFGIPRNMQNVPFSEDSPMRQKYPQGFNCGDECLMNAVYQQGEENAELYPDAEDPGAAATMDAVSGITGLEVQFYAMIDLKGFEDLIDAMGGLTINAGKRVPISGPINPATGKHVAPKGWIEPGTQKMDGFTALWFARSREFASDYERMVRQRCVQEAMLKQLDPATLLLRFQGIAKAAPDVVKTDIPEAQLADFADLAVKAKGQEIGKASFVPPEVTPARPDFDKVRQIVTETLESSQNSAEAAGAPRLLAAGAGPENLAASVPPEPSDGPESEREICYVP